MDSKGIAPLDLHNRNVWRGFAKSASASDLASQVHQRWKLWIVLVPSAITTAKILMRHTYPKAVCARIRVSKKLKDAESDCWFGIP